MHICIIVLCRKICIWKLNIWHSLVVDWCFLFLKKMKRNLLCLWWLHLGANYFFFLSHYQRQDSHSWSCAFCPKPALQFFLINRSTLHSGMEVSVRIHLYSNSQNKLEFLWDLRLLKSWMAGLHFRVNICSVCTHTEWLATGRCLLSAGETFSFL